MATNDKESSAAGTDNRPPMLEESDFTAPYSEPLAITTTTAFEVSHEDAYDSDVDKAPHAAATFMANLMQTGPSTGQGTIESVPTDVSSVIPGGISMITILDDLRSQLAGHIKTNEEQTFANDSLKAELERYKTQVQNLEQKQLVSLKQQLLQHVESNKSLKTESEKLKADKNALEESYLEELVWLRNTNKVVTELLQSYGQPVQTVPMLSKRPTFSTKDLHKSALGDVIVDPVHTPFRVYDSEETLVQAEVSRTKMLERMKDPLCKVSSKPINYAKLNSLYDTFVPQKQLSSEQVYWLPANEVASYNCNQSKPITTFVRTRPAKSQVYTQLKMLKACFPEFDKLDKNLLIQNECLLAESVSKDICSVVLTFDIAMPMSVEPRSNCVKEHSRNLELEAKILKSKAESNSNVSSRATVPEKPKVLAPGLYAMTL
ncbi:hypothetical protein Tco_1372296, partial [Tanacetum coccineum]